MLIEFLELGLKVDFTKLVSAIFWLIILIKLGPSIGKWIKEMIDKYIKN